MPDCCASVRGAACHCPRCHRTFSGIGLFDRHQDVDYARSPAVLCREPSSLGLVQGDSGTWHTPEGLQRTTTRTATLLSARRHAAA